MCDDNEIKQKDILFDEEEGEVAQSGQHSGNEVARNAVSNVRADYDDVYRLERRDDLLISSLRNELEYQNIMAAMAVSGNREKAAEKLCISPRTLRYKINKLRDLGMAVPTAYARV